MKTKKPIAPELIACEQARAASRESAKESVKLLLEEEVGKFGQLYDQLLREMEIPLLSGLLEKHRGNQSKVSRHLGLNRSTLRKKLKKHGFIKSKALTGIPKPTDIAQ